MCPCHSTPYDPAANPASQRTSAQASAIEVRRDGVLQPGGRFGTGDLTADSNAAFEYILRHQGQSVDWAIHYEGWSIVTIAPDGTETSDR